MKLTDEFESIRKWASERGIYSKGDVKTQCLKLQEEVGELAKAILQDNKEEVIDAIGDCCVVLTNLAELSSIYFKHTCKSCNGKSGHYEDVVGDGGSRMWIDCEECSEVTIEECINSAFLIISKRTGAMSNGTFVKNN